MLGWKDGWQEDSSLSGMSGRGRMQWCQARLSATDERRTRMGGSFGYLFETSNIGSLPSPYREGSWPQYQTTVVSRSRVLRAG